jgi:8-oxo-dGTP diphosphatase
VTFCSRCGSRLAGPPPTTCVACGYELYVNARPTGGVVVVDGDRFLALRRAAEPKAGEWELPGGFCQGREHPADAARREAREELGVDVELGAFLGMWVGGYDFQGETLPVLDCFWMARPAGTAFQLDPGESSDYTWLPTADHPKLAFPSMDAAIAVVLAVRPR